LWNVIGWRLMIITLLDAFGGSLLTDRQLAMSTSFHAIKPGGGDGAGTSTRLNKYLFENPATGVPRHLQRQNCTRLVVFNTQRTTISTAWEELRAMLPENMFSSIVSLQRFTYGTTNPRIDMWVRPDIASSLVRTIRRMTRDRTRDFVSIPRPVPGRTTIMSSWRVAFWRSYGDRKDTKVSIPSKPEESFNCLATFNVNGLHRKRGELIDFLTTERVAICAVQETLISDKNYPPKIKGYRSFSLPKVAGFRGQALLVRSNLPAYEVPCKYNPNVLYVRVSRVGRLTEPLHVFAVYLPSGGAERGRKTELLHSIRDLARGILGENPNAPILCLGDFNVIPSRVESLDPDVLRYMVPVGDPDSRFASNGDSKPLDHFLASESASRIIHKPRVLRNYVVSDHRPVVVSLKDAPLIHQTSIPIKRLDNKMLMHRAASIVHSNKWAALPVDHITEESIGSSIDEFTTLYHTVLESEGAVKDSVGHNAKLPRKLRNVLRLKRRLAKQLNEESRFSSPPELLIVQYNRAKAKFKKLWKSWELKNKQRAYTQIAADFLTHDSRNVWRRLTSQTSDSAKVDCLQPVRDKQGVLQTDKVSILKATTAHYKAVAANDPSGASKDAEHWAAIDLGPPKPTLTELNEAIPWKELLVTIREMKRNTAPGLDGVHVNVLKSLVREECMAYLKVLNPDFRRPDNIYVDLPEDELPTEPCTPMGTRLFRILTLVWESEEVPSQWDKVVFCSIFKPGAVNPELLDNYRGVALISCVLKCLLAVMARRLEVSLTRNKLLCREQGGFRSGQEAIAQVIALSEIVRRRHLRNESTYGVFIDFRKAFPSVPHEGLFRVLEHTGVRGRFLNFSRHMYNHTEIGVRVGGEILEYYPMTVGSREGCPLSPIFFDAYINSFFDHATRKGVFFDGCKGEACPGLLYADDIVGLAEDLASAKEFCLKAYDWGVKWGMRLGLAKCGVMLWSSDHDERLSYEAADFATPDGVLPKVEEYKYLGIVVDSTLGSPRTKGDRSDDLELRHSKRQKEKGMRALHLIRPLLHDKRCPIYLKVMLVRNLVMAIMLYGSELIGYRKVNVIPMQAVVNTAVRWIMGLRSSSRDYDSLTLMFELSIPPIEVEVNARRTRLWQKLIHSDISKLTWLGQLVDYRPGGQKHTWVTLNMTWFRKYVDNPAFSNKYNEDYVNRPGYHYFNTYFTNRWYWDYENEGKMSPSREWVARARVYEAHVRSNNYTSSLVQSAYEQLTGLTSFGSVVEANPEAVYRLSRGFVDVTIDYADEWVSIMESLSLRGGRTSAEAKAIQLVRDVTLERLLTSCKSSGFIFYNLWHFGASRGFLRQQMNRIDISEGTRWLIAIRSNGFPQVNRTWERISRGGRTPTFDKGRCPLCNEVVVSEYSWAHLLMNCQHREVLLRRQVYLSDPLTFLQEFAMIDNWEYCRKIQDHMGITSEPPVFGLWALILIGGVAHWSLYENSYHLGFGQIDVLPQGLTSHLYVYTASFFQRVAPIYTSFLGGSVSRLEVGESELLDPVESSGESSVDSIEYLLR
jgi:exonuclease III